MIRSLPVAILLLIVFAVPAHAQKIKQWGGYGGITSSGHQFDQDDPFGDGLKRRTGVHMGGFVEWLDIPHFSIVTQAGYVQKGAHNQYPQPGYEYPLTTGDTVTAHARIDYLSLCVLAKVAAISSVASPYILAGPRLDFKLGESGGAFSLKGTYENFTTIVFGFSGGGGIQTTRILPAVLFVQFLYHVDLQQSYEGRNDLFFIQFKNSSFDISLGVGL